MQQATLTFSKGREGGPHQKLLFITRGGGEAIPKLPPFQSSDIFICRVKKKNMLNYVCIVCMYNTCMYMYIAIDWMQSEKRPAK